MRSRTHLVAPPGPGLLQPALHPRPDQPLLQLHHLPRVFQIRLGHPPFHPGAGHPVPLALPADGEGLPGRADHHVGGPFRLLCPGRLDLLPDPGPQPLHPEAAQGGHHHVHTLPSLGRIDQQVGLRPHHQPPPLLQRRVERRHLGPKGGQVLRGRPGQVHHVQQHPAPRDVPKEGQPQAPALRGALDQAGDVRHHEPFVVAGHAQVRGQRGERVIGDLRPGRGQLRQQGGLARVGQPHQADVGHQAELELEVKLLPRFARFGHPGNPVPGPGQDGAPPAPSSTPSHRHRRSGSHQVGQQATFVPHHRPVGHRKEQILPLCPVAVVLRPPAAAGGPVPGPVRVGRQVVQRRIHPKDHVAALPPVAPVGTSPRVERLTADGRAPGPAFPGRHHQPNLIDEHPSIMVGRVHPAPATGGREPRELRSRTWTRGPARCGWSTGAPARTG